MASATGLSATDSAVLSALFDPEASLTNAIHITKDDPGSLSTSPNLPTSTESAAVKLISSSNPSLQSVREAISMLDTIIAENPTHPSAYVNRAQASRLLTSWPSSPTAGDAPILTSILSDLDMAIEHSTPKSASAPVPASTARVLSSAHSHRAFILYKFSRPEHPESVYGGIPALGIGRCSKEELEELSSRDFAAGGRYGNSLAREMSVRTNPYAKLCGSIVKEAMRREIEMHYRPDRVEMESR